MKRNRITSMLAVGAVVTLALALIGGPAGAKSRDGVHSFHGTVNSVAKGGGGLSINTRNRSRVRFVVRASTTFEHIAGLGRLSKGTPVEVHAFRSGDRWIATRIEANPGRGGHGGDDHGSDDHGSGGHGSDD